MAMIVRDRRDDPLRLGVGARPIRSLFFLRMSIDGKKKEKC